MKRWLRRFGLLLRRDAVEASMDAEMRHHLECEMRDRIAAGMTPDEARRSALIDFGGVDRFKEEGRDARGTRGLEDLARDLRYAGRVLRRNPGFAAASGVTFALGIGATTAIFSVVYGVLLRPLPYREPRELVALWEQNLSRNTQTNVVSFATFNIWRERTNSFTGMAALVPRPFTLASQPTPERVSGAEVSPGYFTLLGVHPALGRDFLEGDTEAVILSDSFWRVRLGADPAAVGRSLAISGVPHTIVGVMPADFDPPRFAWLQRQDAWFPLVETAQSRAWGRFLLVIARLRTGVTVAAARTELAAVAARLEQQSPAHRGWSATAVPLRAQLTGEARTPLIAVSVAVTLLLLLAVTNVGTLTLSMMRRRVHELAIRRAIGATDRRLLNQLLVQSALIGLVGTALGLLTAVPALRVLQALLPADIPRPGSIALDRPVLLAAIVMAVTATLAFGGVAARRTGTAGSASVLLASTRSARRTGGGVLVAAEIAIGLALAVLALLTARSFAQLRAVDLGFEPSGVVAARIALPGSYDSPDRRRIFFHRLIERLESVPGLARAGVISTRPFGGLGPATTVHDAAGPPPGPGQELVADARFADGGYFATMRIQVLRGSVFGETDRFTGAPAVVVSEALARAVFGTADAVGRTLHVNMFDGLDAEILGVVADAHLADSRTPPRPALYLSTGAFTDNARDVVVRVDGEVHATVAAIKLAIASIDPAVPVHQVTAMRQVIDDSLATDRFAAYLLGGFALIALLLAGVGVFGVFSSDVAARRREIGIRLALGSSSRGILGLFLRRAVSQAALGVLVGSLVAVVIARLLSSLLFGVSAADPLTLLTAALAAMALAASATVLPAWLAMRHSPLDTLRES
jgi:putative ABC transport system permease protein